MTRCKERRFPFKRLEVPISDHYGSVNMLNGAFLNTLAHDEAQVGLYGAAEMTVTGSGTSRCADGMSVGDGLSSAADLSRQ